MIFRQKGPWLSRREYIIEQDGVRAIVRSLTGTSKKLFDFHHVGKVIIRKRKRSWFSLLLSLLFLGYGCWLVININNGGGGNQIDIAIGSILLAMAFLISFFLTGQKYLYLWSKKHEVFIKFLDNNPSEDAIITFIAHINKAQRVRLQQLYLTIDENISYEEHRNNIQWLRDNDFLSKKEAEQRLGKVKANFT